jgi:hypothetical protein
MKTDWELIRTSMMAAIDTCEQLEATNLTEWDKGKSIYFKGHDVSISDAITSAWIYPEKLRYEVVRQRHSEGCDQPYVPETARIIVSVAEACAELIGAGMPAPMELSFKQLASWYRDHAVPLVDAVLHDKPLEE